MCRHKLRTEEWGQVMEGVGWIAAIIIGGVAGWLAEQFVKSNMGVLMNILLGIVGAILANWLFGLIGIRIGSGWVPMHVTVNRMEVDNDVFAGLITLRLPTDAELAEAKLSGG